MKHILFNKDTKVSVECGEFLSFGKRLTLMVSSNQSTSFDGVVFLKSYPCEVEYVERVLRQATDHCSLSPREEVSISNMLLEEVLGVGVKKPSLVVDWTKGIPSEVM
jgi:hypothetical protein